MKSTYLLVNLLTISIPFCFSFHPQIRFYQNWHAFWPAAMLTGIGFLAWDVWFTGIGIWRFNETYHYGVYLYNLPLEEVLFFICIPYACVFTYFCLKQWHRFEISEKHARQVTLCLILLCIILAVVGHERLYTLLVCIGTASLLVLHLAVFKTCYLGQFYVSYVVLLMPFLLVNGILTGTAIPAEVVWYNDAENLGLRFGTIPAEDFIYALFLILTNVTLYEALLVRTKAK